MPESDDYAAKEAVRRRQYESAFKSDAARSWIASLTPAQRADAERLGLLTPYFEGSASGHNSIENLPRDLEPRVEDSAFDESILAEPLRKRSAAEAALKELGLQGVVETQEFADFLMQKGNPRLRWACICYIRGEGTLEQLSQSLGMSKQAFHYHVRQLQNQLGIESVGNQKSVKARKSYRMMNHQRRSS